MFRGSFPSELAKKDEHFHIIVPYIENNETRWGLDPAKAPALRALFGDPAAPVYGTWVYWWPLYCDEYHSRTPEVTDEMNKTWAKIEETASNIYNNIPADKWTDLDRETLHRKTGLPKAKAVHHKKPIKDKVFFSATPATGGKFDFVCRTVHDSTPASLAADADGVEVAYGIFPYEFKTDEDSGETSSIPKRLATGVGECPMRQTFYKARFTATPEGEKKDRYINFYLRWINTTHPELNGDWCGPVALDFLQ